jgi:hypothetical protein
MKKFFFPQPPFSFHFIFCIFENLNREGNARLSTLQCRQKKHKNIKNQTNQMEKNEHQQEF